MLVIMSKIKWVVVIIIRNKILSKIQTLKKKAPHKEQMLDGNSHLMRSTGNAGF